MWSHFTNNSSNNNNVPRSVTFIIGMLCWICNASQFCLLVYFGDASLMAHKPSKFFSFCYRYNYGWTKACGPAVAVLLLLLLLLLLLQLPWLLPLLLHCCWCMHMQGWFKSGSSLVQVWFKSGSSLFQDNTWFCVISTNALLIRRLKRAPPCLKLRSPLPQTALPPSEFVPWSVTTASALCLPMRPAEPWGPRAAAEVELSTGPGDPPAAPGPMSELLLDTVPELRSDAALDCGTVS